MKIRHDKALLTLAAPLALLLSTAFAGDRAGVLATLDRASGNWSAADLKAKLAGTQQGEVTLGSNVAFGYEARNAGYAAVLHVNSHGEMQLFRQASAGKSKSGQSEVFQASQPLGTETAYVIFSDASLDSLFGGSGTSVTLGDSRSDAEKFASSLGQAADKQKIAVSRVQYQVVATAGATEYTTRGIVRKIVDADEDEGSAGAETTRAAHTIPARIEFAFNSADLTPQGRLDLDVFGEALLSNELSGRALSLQGHTDNVGSDTYNCDLSRRRAEAARQYLVKSFGVESSRIVLAAFGESKPMVANTTEAARHQNRRVEFVFNRPGETSRSVSTPCSK